MKTLISKDNDQLKVSVSGSLNTETAPDLEKVLIPELKSGIVSVSFDFTDLDYISSAGLRVLLLVCKKVGEDGKVIVKNAKPGVKEVFQMTGFDAFLVLE